MTEAQEILLTLIEHAKTSEHMKFEQLRFYHEYTGAKLTYRSLRRVVAALRVSANSLFRKYCQAVKQQQADMNILLAYKQVQLTVDYFREEQKIVKAIIDDYKKYFWEGDFLKDFILGQEREV